MEVNGIEPIEAAKRTDAPAPIGISTLVASTINTEAAGYTLPSAIKNAALEAPNRGDAAPPAKFTLSDGSILTPQAPTTPGSLSNS